MRLTSVPLLFNSCNLLRKSLIDLYCIFLLFLSFITRVQNIWNAHSCFNYRPVLPLFKTKSLAEPLIKIADREYKPYLCYVSSSTKNPFSTAKKVSISLMNIKIGSLQVLPFPLISSSEITKPTFFN